LSSSDTEKYFKIDLEFAFIECNKDYVNCKELTDEYPFPGIDIQKNMKSFAGKKCPNSPMWKP
jgi:hypothetical protein